MTTKTEKTTNTTTELTTALIELLKELQVATRQLNPKTSTLRQVKRGIANVEAIISDVKEELK